MIGADKLLTGADQESEHCYQEAQHQKDPTQLEPSLGQFWRGLVLILHHIFTKSFKKFLRKEVDFVDKL